MPFSVERRAAIARRLHHIDGWTSERIADYFREQGIADIKPRTVRGYFDAESAEETKQIVRESHADEDLRIARSLQRKHDRSRMDERRATKDEEITAYRPATTVNSSGLKKQVPDWEVVNHQDHRAPEWAEERDTVIEFKPHQRITIHPGEEYYVADPAGNPTYEEAVVGVDRDVPDLAERRRLREDQRRSLEGKATRLGIDDNELDVNLGGSINLEHSVPDEIVTAVVGASHNRLDSNADGPSSEDKDDS
ncbi:hypothetical protein [Halococcus sp. AFM35]|uniref:hypothetical protein n=1 Tax=Halococcus sp. AFM35 TaxID=3421653 RepID=UPI003EB708B2